MLCFALCCRMLPYVVSNNRMLSYVAVCCLILSYDIKRLLATRARVCLMLPYVV